MAEDVEGKDWETIVLETSPKFWKFIEERRKQPTICLAEMRQRLEGLGPGSRSPRPSSGSSGRRIG